MSMATEAKIKKLEEQMSQMQFQMSQVMSAIAAMVEVNDANAVVEGDDIQPKARNGQVKKAHR